MSVQIPLTQGQFAIVDDEDAELVIAQGKWHARVKDRTTYAVRTIRAGKVRRSLRLHTFLTGWLYVDHVNGDGLDNRRANLRQATHGENMRNRRRQRNNTSGFVGVRFVPARGWYAYIKANGVMRNLGHHATAEDAARVRDAAAVELHGEFARLNFPVRVAHDTPVA